jgi:iron complex transport system substrate-binding protein
MPRIDSAPVHNPKVVVQNLKRICSFLPSATEIVYSLGLESQLFGVTHECDYPPEARKKPRLTTNLLPATALSSIEIDHSVKDALSTGRGIYGLDFEALKHASPDIIFTQELCEVCAVSYGEIFRAAQKLPAKPEVISLDTFTLGDILGSIHTVGERCGKAGEAEEFVGALQRRIEHVTSLAKNGPSTKPKRVFLMEWIDPIMTAGHWNPEVVRIAGGEDSLAQEGKNSRRVSWEEVRSYAPDYLVIAPCGFGVERAEIEACAVLPKLDGWSELPAVKNGNVFVADGNAYFSRPGPRIVDGIEMLACMLNPNLPLDQFRERFTRNDWRQFA